MDETSVEPPPKKQRTMALLCDANDTFDKDGNKVKYLEMIYATLD
jgi:hypothetical protein